MKVSSTDFRVKQEDRVNLDKWPTAVEPIYESKKQYQKLLSDHVTQLSALQQLLYASNRYAILLIFQAMDAAGKDGAIRHVMSGVNPQGCQVFSYKHPSAMELRHSRSLRQRLKNWSETLREDRNGKSTGTDAKPACARKGNDRPPRPGRVQAEAA